ncbi:MAG: DegV family protein [Candidatus Hodarchaeota archaeon]
MKAGIVTDSMSDLPPELANKYGVVIVPGTVFIDDEPYRSGIDIFPSDIEDLISENNKKISTGAPSAAEYYDAYTYLCDSVDIIISIHSPSKVTATSSVAKVAAKRLEDPTQVIRFECGVGSLGLGLTAIATAITAKQVEDLSELLRRVTQYCERIKIIGTLDSFKYLQRSGRVKLKIAGFLANTFSIKPVLMMQGEDISLLKKPRSRQRALDLMIESVLNSIDIDFNPKMIGIGHFSCVKEAKMVEGIIRDNFPDHEIIQGNVDPMIAAHTGPGLILLSFFSSLDKSNRGEKIND